jgi:putative transcriptional regulator
VPTNIPEDISAEELDEARRYSLVIRWSDEDQVYIVSVPELPGLLTHGKTIADAEEMGAEAIATWLSGLRLLGREIPAPPERARRLVIDKAPNYNAEAVRAIRKRLDVSQAVFAEALNVSPSTVRSWEQGQRAPDGASRRLLEVAEREPAVLFRGIEGFLKQTRRASTTMKRRPSHIRGTSRS